MTITAPATTRYGFESYNVYSAAGQCYCFAYAPNTGAWVFSGAAGVSENGTCLTSGNPPTPHMTRTAFLQTGGRMAITVTGLTVSETYRIGFVMARRGNYNAHLARTFTVTMGGQNLGVYSPLTTTWEQALTGAVVANAASLQLVLEAGAEPGNDSMALIDDVAVMPAHPHAARAMGNGNSFEYDANGNMTVRREKLDGISYVYTQTWTIDNRLASVVKSDVTGTILATTTISYDGDGVRVKKSDPSGTTYYLGAVEVLVTGTTQVTTSYYAFGGAMVAMRTTATATLTYLHGDHLGSASLTTNASGQKVSEQRYKPYGEVRWSSGAGMPTDFTFTSQRAGPANYVGSLMDYNARFFSPALGRFISADTIVPGAGKPAALNRYMYVLGNPLGMVDPSGHGACAGKSNDDFWQCRWFTAHGYEQNSAQWRHTGVVNFEGLDMVTELLGEAGVTWLSGDKNWEWKELTSVSTGVSHLMFKVGGGATLAKLLGGVIVSLVRMADGVNGCTGTAACKVSDTRVEFYDGLNTYDFEGRGGVAVHELAHIIGTVTRAGDVKTNLFTVFPHDANNYFSDYGKKDNVPGNGEYFSEAVFRWVYPKAAGDPREWALTIDQADWLSAHLR